MGEWRSTAAAMKNRKTFLLLLLFLTIHLVFASKVKRHGSKGGKHGVRPLVPGKGAAGYLLKTQRGKIYLQTPRKGKKSLKTSPASLNKRLPTINQEGGKWSRRGPKKWKPHDSPEWTSNEETWTTTSRGATWPTPGTTWTTPETTWTTPKTTWTTPKTTWTTPKTKWTPHGEMGSTWTTPGKRWREKPTPKKWKKRDSWNNSLRHN